ncbi:MAG TPA: type II toxin-antitoxin system VapB family antitoxin [Casimicrobiaceae bacterium]|nr:type II toxin-antitoxin system VapB family antitoxin [Casimicrobiaceae bacterium]
MKTTVEIPDALLEEARKLAARHGTTLRVLIIEGLRNSIAERRRASPFKLRNASVTGEGLQPGIEPTDWNWIRQLTYEGCGG